MAHKGHHDCKGKEDFSFVLCRYCPSKSFQVLHLQDVQPRIARARVLTQQAGIVENGALRVCCRLELPVLLIRGLDLL